jgi:exosortase
VESENSSLTGAKNKMVLASLFLFSIWFSIFYPVYPELFSTWMNHSNNSHGILVPIISVFLIWQKRKELSREKIGSSAWGAVILIVSICLYIIAYAGAIAVVSRAMIVFSLMGLILFNFGRRIFSIIAFPLFYLIFMVPVPESIYTLVAFPLQLFATKISAFLINAFSIPVLREGNMLYFANTQLEVAEACSGLRSMTSYIMLSFLFAYMMKKSWRNRILIILSAIPLALITNIIRVTGTGILAHFYGDRAARSFLHEFSGLAVFALGFMMLLGLYGVLNKLTRD